MNKLSFNLLLLLGILMYSFTANAQQSEKLSFDFSELNENISFCSFSWTNQGVSFTVNEVDGTCCAGIYNGMFMLCPAKILVDLTNIKEQYNIISIKGEDNCGKGCTGFEVYIDGALIKTISNTDVGEVFELNYNIPRGKSVDSIILFSYEGAFSSIEITKGNHQEEYSNTNKNNNELIISRSNKNPSLTYGSLTDQDGNKYKTVRIGNMEWMAENLRSSTFCNGDTILFAPRSDVYMYLDKQKKPWQELTVGAWSYYGGNVNSRDIHQSRADINAYYGKLYNWYAAVDSRNICPCGWRVPYVEEWKELLNYFGGSRPTFNAIKSNHDGFWKYPDSVETGYSGFEALAGGYRNLDGSYSHLGEMGNWWGQNEGKYDKSTGAKARIWFIPEINQRQFSQGFGSKTLGYSVRCIKARKSKAHLEIKEENIRERYTISDGEGAVDVAGNHYKTMVFNRQEWFIENLRTHLFNNGDSIPELSDIDIQNNVDGVMSSYQDNSKFDREYGKLYNGYVVEDKRGICPTGWQVMNDWDWNKLLRSLGGKNTAGEVLLDEDVNFISTLSGYWDSQNKFSGKDRVTSFWTATAYPGDSRYLFSYSISDEGNITITSESKNRGKSIRCARKVK